MTAPLPAGSLLVDPADVGLLAVLVREGAARVAQRRRLPTQVADLMAAVEQAAAEARAAAGVASNSTSTASGGTTAPSLDMTVQEAASAIGCSPGWVRQLVSGGSLHARRVGGRVLLLDRDAVAALVLSRRSGKRKVA